MILFRNNLVAAIVYFIGAFAGLLIALPPGNVSPIWPASGLALFIALRYDKSVIPGLILGAFASQLYSFTDTSSTEAILRSASIGFLIGCGSVLQAFIGKALICQYVGKDDPLLEDQKIILFLVLGGPVACTVAATIGSWIITAANIINPSDFVLTWMTWWVGDTIGVLIILPVLLIFFGKPRASWHQRINTVFYPLLFILLFMIGLFQYGKSQDLKGISNDFNELISLFHYRIEEKLNNHLLLNNQLHAFFTSIRKIPSASEFVEFSNFQLQNNSDIQAVEWIPLVKNSMRDDFEQSLSIREPAENNEMVIASERDEYLPIYYLNPQAGNEKALGYDISTNPVAKKAVHLARDTAETVMAEPLQLIQDNEYQYGIIIYTPIYEFEASVADLHERRTHFIGVVASVFRVADLMQVSLSRLKNFPVNITIKEGNQTIYSRNLDDQRHDLSLWDLTNRETVRIANRELHFTYSPSLEFYDSHLYWHTWWLIIIGLIITALAGAGLLMITGRTLRTEELILTRTEELTREVSERRHTEYALEKIARGFTHADEENFFNSLVEYLVEILSVDYAFVGQYLPAEESMQTVAAFGEGQFMDNFKYELSGTPCENVVHGLEFCLYSENVQQQFPKDTLLQEMGVTHFAGGPMFDSNGSLLGIIVVLSKTGFEYLDLTKSLLRILCIRCANEFERRETQSLLTYQATHDALTGLVNRTEFESRLSRLIDSARSYDERHALCYMDLDQFKLVNDTCGHTAGDELLRQLSQLLLDTIRNRDTLARLGGDEFAVIIEHCSIENAQRVADSLLQTIQNFHFSYENHTFNIGISIGLVEINELSGDMSEIMKNADVSCYTAKEMGRNRIHVYTEEDLDSREYHGKLQWVNRIYEALNDDRFALYIQAIEGVNVTPKTNYEVLLRMLDDNGDVIAPGAFLPAAERYGLMSKIDSWVTRNVLEFFSKNPELLNDIGFISINLSGQSLGTEGFDEFVINSLEQSSHLAEKICFEITETAIISNFNRAITFIESLTQLGCRFALDDFGSGLSSFAYLKRLPVNYIKIDGMFIKNITSDEIDYAMVKSILELVDVMQMQTIAEYVEDDKSRVLLTKMGIDLLQGFGIEHPKPIEEMLNESAAS